jgi:formylglycine-generating enzyme required for sulfatase activity
VRAGPPLLVAAMSILVAACGDSFGPASDLTPSILSLAYTGDSLKLVGNCCNGATLPEDPAISMGEESQGAKGACAVTASWTICSVSSFHSYSLYRSENAGISADPSAALLLGVFSDSHTTDFVDDDMEWAAKYYYALCTSDDEDNFAWSNEDSITTPGTAPTPSLLAEDGVSTAGVDLLWSLCPDSDFDSYRLFRSDTPDIEDDTTYAERVYTGTAVENTAFTDTMVEPDCTYYYALMTMNTNGCSSWSNELEIIIPYVDLPQGMEFVAIPSGSFVMGAPAEEAGSSFYERPVHQVTFSYPFEMMTTEVTQGIWEEMEGNNPSCFSGASLPVECVSWYDCQDFVDAMNDLDPSHEYRLPSEAEWEYSCRAGTTTRFYWGDDPGETGIGDYAWWNGNSDGTTHPVAQKLANAWGLFDMSGNVWEWCEDYWHGNYEGAPYDGSPWLVPASSWLVRRGGSWGYDAPHCRSANRYFGNPGLGGLYLGFRLVRSDR